MLPENFVKRNLERAKGVTLFGKPIERMSRDELVACVVAGWEGQARMREQHKHDLDTLLMLRR